MSQATVLNVSKNTILGDCVDLANSGKTRNKGLLGREGLGPGEGLWIVPCEAIHMFFMKFAIDAVFLDKQRLVTKVVADLKPWRLAMSWRAHSVIELPAGTAERTSTAAGDQIEVRENSS